MAAQTSKAAVEVRSGQILKNLLMDWVCGVREE